MVYQFRYKCLTGLSKCKTYVSELNGVSESVEPFVPSNNIFNDGETVKHTYNLQAQPEEVLCSENDSLIKNEFEDENSANQEELDTNVYDENESEVQNDRTDFQTEVINIKHEYVNNTTENDDNSYDYEEEKGE